MAKIRNFLQFWGLYSHIFAPINVKFGTGERTCGLLPRAKFHVYRGNVSPLRSEKPIFGPLSNNNTGMAALRAGLSVKKTKSEQKKITLFRIQPARDSRSPPYTWHGDEEVRPIFAPPNFFYPVNIFAARGY